MELKVNIPFQELLTLVRQLTSAQKATLQQELTQEPSAASKKQRIADLLMNGPVLTDEQLEMFEQIRNEINQWRTPSP